MRSIYQLIPDIYELVGRHDGWFSSALAQELSLEISNRLQLTLGERKESSTLRLSKMADYCPRELWYSIHHPELAEKLPGQAYIKFSYGHILEALIIALAKAAGHEVTGEQDELVVDGIKGHRDCVIDGYVVDVKSCSGRVFEKFETGSIREDDSFGYLAQLDGYLVGSASDDLVRHKDRGFILAIDKVLGKLFLYEHHVRREFIQSRISRSKQIVSLATPPACECGTVKHGESGNRSLNTKASYSLFKRQCFPNLRTFAYKEKSGTKLVHLTHVAREPNVPELTRDGRWVYTTK